MRGPRTARGSGCTRRSSREWSSAAPSTGSADASTARASARCTPPPARGKKGSRSEPADHALGRSRGGWGSKLHLACDGRGTITAFRLTGGQINECSEVLALLTPIHIGQRWRPRALLGDKAYSMRALRAWARRYHVRLVVPERAVGWLKHWRRIATRAEKLALTYRAAVCLVLAVRYATKYFSDTT